MTRETAEFEPGDLALATQGLFIVRADALRNFRAVVAALGGDAVELLRRSRIEPATIENPHAVLSYRAMVQLLERAAIELRCPDFGMRLAAAQGGTKGLNPLAVAMRNSRTVGEAFRYCADHVQAYSTATQICIERMPANQHIFIRFEILLARLPHQRQAVEHALLLMQQTTLNVSGGRARAREIWFTHEPGAALETYNARFNATLRFGQRMNGAFFREHDFELSVPNSDPQLYEMASGFIDHRFPSVALILSTRVRSLVGRLLADGNCTHEHVAALLGLHPRSLQRRLRAHGETFEEIKDSVRREVALRYLQQRDMPLIRIAEYLGYSETSVLSRSCFRWFAESPRQLRNRLCEAVPLKRKAN